MKNIKKIIKDNIIENIFLVGFIDVEDGIAQFYNDLRFLYFEINNNYIEFESVNQFSKLKIKIVDSIQYDYEVDEDMIKAKTSISEIVLNDLMAKGNEIDKIIFYNLEEKDELLCDALEIILINGQVIFLDPSYCFGINIGGTEKKYIWLNNLKENMEIRKTCLNVFDK